jgi:DNA-binding HxlR family transcriptional regulator
VAYYSYVITTPCLTPSAIDDGRCRGFLPVAELLGHRWTAAVLLAGCRGARRFAEYRAQVPGISDRLLSARLKELVRQGLLVRRVTPSTPVLITYEPTAGGAALSGALDHLVRWSETHALAEAGD